MRLLVGLSAVLLVAACSGAASNELFTGDAVVLVDADAATEPSGPATANDDDEEAKGDADAKDAAAADAADAGKDSGGKDAAKEAAANKCFFDGDCADGDLCNWKTDTCAAPGPLGAPCKRDLECTGGLCNWKLETCSVAAAAGAACRRNKECASGACGANSICK